MFCGEARVFDRMKVNKRENDMLLSSFRRCYLFLSYSFSCLFQSLEWKCVGSADLSTIINQI